MKRRQSRTKRAPLGRRSIRAGTALTLVTVVALRALVPIGYMVSLPDGDAAKLALHLCPTQNRTLDLSVFATTHAPGSGHHAHADTDHDSSTTTSVRVDCHAWLGSAAFALATVQAVPDFGVPTLSTPPDAAAGFIDHTQRSTLRARAPPRYSA